MFVFKFKNKDGNCKKKILVSLLGMFYVHRLQTNIDDFFW
jgi:hypothetical protein